MPSSACRTGRWPAAAATVVSRPRLRAEMWMTTKTAAGRSGGSWRKIRCSGRVAPLEPPMTMMSRLPPACIALPFEFARLLTPRHVGRSGCWYCWAAPASGAASASEPNPLHPAEQSPPVKMVALPARNHPSQGTSLVGVGFRPTSTYPGLAGEDLGPDELARARTMPNPRSNALHRGGRQPW